MKKLGVLNSTEYQNYSEYVVYYSSCTPRLHKYKALGLVKMNHNMDVVIIL